MVRSSTTSMTSGGLGSSADGRVTASSIDRENVAHLAVFAPNWLGDAVLALPAIADVRRAFPSARVAMVARPSVAPLFDLIPDLDTTIVLARDRAGRHKSVEHVHARKFDAALLLPNSFQSALLAWRAGIPQRWGYRAECRGPLLTRRVTRPPAGHQGAYYQHLVQDLGFDNGPVEPRIEPSPDVRRSAGELLRASGWDGRTCLVALAPGAAYGGAKRWPLASFAAVADALLGDGVSVALVGSTPDADAAGELLRQMSRGSGLVVNLVGRTELPVLAGVLVHCQALVTNDSGAMHIGAAVGVRVTAMFGPTDEHATRPLGAGHEVLTHRIWCRPCMLRECPLDHRCMRGIGVDAVLASARRTL